MRQTAPHPSVTDSRLNRRHAQEWWAMALALLVLLGTVACKLWREHGLNREKEFDRLQTQARVVDENLIRQLQGVNRALAGLRYDLYYSDHPGETPNMSRRLQLLADAMPGVRDLSILDKSGIVIGSNNKSALGADLHQSPYFEIPQASPDYAALYISPNYLPSSGFYAVGVSKAVSEVDGQFIGLISATLEPSYFDTVMQSVLYAPDMTVSITHNDGRVFIMIPPNVKSLNTNINVPGALFHRHVQSGQTISQLVGQSKVLGDQRMLVFRNIQPAELRMYAPLTVSVSRNLAEVDAVWWDEAKLNLGLLAAFGTIACIGLAYIHKHRRAMHLAHIEIQEALKETAQRFEFGLKGADLGLWDWNMAKNTMVFSDRLWQMLGYQPNEILLRGGLWWQLLHPQELPVLRAAFIAHIKGHSPSYKLEHRVRHKDGHWIWVLDHAMVAARDEKGRVTRVLGTHMDVSERKQAEAHLAAATALQRRTGEIAKIGGWELDLSNMLQTWTPEVFLIYDLSVGTPLSLDESLNCYTPDSRHKLEQAMAEAIRYGTPWALELQLTTTAARQVWVHSHGEAIVQEGHTVRLEGTLQDITERMQFQAELQRANEQLAELSVTDGLTGVGNRRFFDQCLASEWARSMRQEQSLALLMIDIDHFKLYNDAYGHLSGDNCLREVARILNTCICRPGELLMRYGGEEFAVLLLDTDIAGATVVARRCLERIRHAGQPHKNSPTAGHVTLSVGIASVIPHKDISEQDLLEQADAALYEAKRQGRDRHVCATQGPPPAPGPSQSEFYLG
jgi:diguanylate cyclase (GGDEF)-like protein/PAS domain S-box-containing protein